MSQASLGSYNLRGVGSISTGPIGHETRHIMAQLWWRNPTQKTNPSWPKNYPNLGNQHAIPGKWPNE